MKKFFKKWGPWIAVGILGSWVAYDHREEIKAAAGKAGNWIGNKCGSNKSDVSCNSETCDADIVVSEPKTEVKAEVVEMTQQPKAQNQNKQRFDRPRYTGTDGKKH